VVKEVIPPETVGRIGAFLRRGGTSAFAVRALYQTTEEQRVEGIIERMKAMGWKSEADNEVESVRAALSRIVKDGVGRRAGYGKYQSVPALEATVEHFAVKHTQTEIFDAPADPVDGSGQPDAGHDAA
ncbi:MAG: hypothetical protein ABIQ09_16555, partial [Jatrophihabitantaceae bacterium]